MGPAPPGRRWLVAALALALCACSARGREVFVREGCGSCHRFRDLGGGLAPDLSEVGSRLPAAAVREQITGAGGRNPASRMPRFTGISWFDLRSLVAFLRR